MLFKAGKLAERDFNCFVFCPHMLWFPVAFYSPKSEHSPLSAVDYWCHGPLNIHKCAKSVDGFVSLLKKVQS